MMPKHLNKTIMLELESGNHTFECHEISPSTANITEVIEVEDDDVISERMAHGQAVTNTA